MEAVRGMLLLRQLCWDDRHQPSALSHHSNALNSLLGKAPASYFFEAIDELGNGLDVKMLASVRETQSTTRRSRRSIIETSAPSARAGSPQSHLRRIWSSSCFLQMKENKACERCGGWRQRNDNHEHVPHRAVKRHIAAGSARHE